MGMDRKSISRVRAMTADQTKEGNSVFITIRYSSDVFTTKRMGTILDGNSRI